MFKYVAVIGLLVFSTAANAQNTICCASSQLTPNYIEMYEQRNCSSNNSKTPREETECKLKFWKEQVATAEALIEGYNKTLKEYKANVDKFTAYLKDMK